MQTEIIWNLIAKKLSKEASPQELIDLENLLRENPELHYPAQTIIDFWNANADQNKDEASKAFEKHLERMRLQESPDRLEVIENQPNINNSPFPFVGNGEKNTRKKLLQVTVLVVLFASIFLLFRNLPSRQVLTLPVVTAKINSEISTKNGSKTNIVLPDGSLVWLNAGSKLSYDRNYGNSKREINLTGEAFFEVVHNSEKPFIIHTSIMDIKVLGTKFNVKSYPSDKTVEATLIRGSIEVSVKNRTNQKIILKPNQKIVLINTERTPIHNAPFGHLKDKEPSALSIHNLTYEPTTGDILETSWVENKLIFQDEPFNELAEQMERWYGVKIRFEDASKEDIRFTGIFKNETIQQALEALRFTTKFNYTILNNEITIL
jgi:transmembrane sensor